MEIVGAKHERAVLKIVLWTGGSFLLFILLCVAGFRGYREWESRHSLRRAEAFFSGGDLRLAALSARRSLDLKPENPGAARLMAKIAEQSGDKAALDWRRKVVKYDPASDEARLELAACAIQFKDPATAEQALSDTSEPSRQTSGFWAMKARIAQAQQNKRAAEEFWTKAVSLAPEDNGGKLELALARLALPDAEKRKSALAMLEALRKDPKQRAPALRALIIDGVAHREMAEKILGLSEQLQALPEAAFSDRLNYLDILRQMGHEKYTGYLTELEEASKASPANLATLIAWMNKGRLGSLAIDFANSLPPEKIQAWPVPSVLADSYVSVNAWSALEQFVANANWGQFDFLRKAYLARAYREQEREVVSQREWAEAEKEASDSSQKLLLLARATAEWRWDKETDKILWDLSRRADAQMEALRTLYQRYTNLGDAPGLYRVLTRLLEVEPADQTFQNNFAQVALLLKVDLDRALKIAADLHREQPANAAFTATYAFALFREGKLAEAVGVMDGLAPDQINDPSVSLYYGIFLAAAGETEKAKPFLQTADKARMFPEERALLGQAKKRAGLK